jgi:hypothetical protein
MKPSQGRLGDLKDIAGKGYVFGGGKCCRLSAVSYQR